ncbi:hypothetical protein OG21DRAFT_1552230 [Imleria badia]|nr:hypothetical protein OG21DRAFT_1552230 [Imleria badia]
MLGWMDGLPSGPAWQSTTLEVHGCKTTRPICLMWHDAREVIEDILCNPIFANHMAFDPHIVMCTSCREYGATIVPIIISSDKTNITCHMGALEMHPVFMTIRNIQSDVRMQATLYAWRCVAFIPTSEFEVHPDFQTLLASHLFHQCMDIVFASLKETAQTGTAMTDSLGYVRNCFTPLVAYTTNLPEQQLVACVTRNTSPVTTATISKFGDPFPHPPQSGATTLEQIACLCAETHPWDIATFQQKAKAIKLLGIRSHLPFWRNWKFANPGPMYFLIGEILHSGHKFVFNHPLKWCKEAAGSCVLDTHYKTQHKRIGVRHFNSGISHINQMTGHEHRDIQRTGSQHLRR